MGPLQPGIECSFCSAHPEVSHPHVPLSVARLALTASSWDLPDDVFTEGEVRPKKKAKAKANGAASAASADGDTKKRGAAEVSTLPLPPGHTSRFPDGAFFNSHSRERHLPQSDDSRPRSPLQAKRNGANRLCSPVLPARPASMRPTALALAPNSCGNISWLETFARGTNAYCVEKGSRGRFLCPSALRRVTQSRKIGKKREKIETAKTFAGTSNSDHSARRAFPLRRFSMPSREEEGAGTRFGTLGRGYR